MTDKQQRFINEYCINGYNASQAYKKAYPKVKWGWNKLAPRLMAKDGIKRAIKIKMDELEEKVGHSYEIAVEMLRKRLGWLNEVAEKGNIQAIQAQTAIIRELDDITGLHKQTIITEPQQKELTEAEAAKAQEIIDFSLHQQGA